ncbi:MAG: hypothetical protein KAJ19_03725 [Gammaproteobacteria bacterium]|nr:hypothetical protein [Gammaproteobacteria bacterium]
MKPEELPEYFRKFHAHKPIVHEWKSRGNIWRLVGEDQPTMMILERSGTWRPALPKDGALEDILKIEMAKLATALAS